MLKTLIFHQSIYIFSISENASIPTDFMVILNDLSASITWGAPSNPGSPVFSYYQLIVTDDSSTTHTNESIPASDLTEFTVTGLLPLTNYIIQLTAVNQLSPILVSSPTVEMELTTNTSGI